jgi:hypothetical protein
MSFIYYFNVLPPVAARLNEFFIHRDSLLQSAAAAG